MRFYTADWIKFPRALAITYINKLYMTMQGIYYTCSYTTHTCVSINLAYS